MGFLSWADKTIIFLLGYLLIFSAVAVSCLFLLTEGKPLFEIGMNPIVMNWIILIFSALAILKVVHELVELDHSHFKR